MSFILPSLWIIWWKFLNSFLENVFLLVSHFSVISKFLIHNEGKTSKSCPILENLLLKLVQLRPNIYIYIWEFDRGNFATPWLHHTFRYSLLTLNTSPWFYSVSFFFSCYFSFFVCVGLYHSLHSVSHMHTEIGSGVV